METKVINTLDNKAVRIKSHTNSLVNQVLGDVDLTQGQFVMVFVVQHVHQISIERMDVLWGGENIIIMIIISQTDRTNIKCSCPTRQSEKVSRLTSSLGKSVRICVRRSW